MWVKSRWVITEKRKEARLRRSSSTKWAISGGRRKGTSAPYDSAIAAYAGESVETTTGVHRLYELARRGKAVLMVSSYLPELLGVCDRIAVMRNGRIEQIGTPDQLYDEPANDFVADFLGEERGLKRLALMTVDELVPGDGPVVEVGAPAADARAAMEAQVEAIQPPSDAPPN